MPHPKTAQVLILAETKILLLAQSVRTPRAANQTSVVDELGRYVRRLCGNTNLSGVVRILFSLPRFFEITAHCIAGEIPARRIPFYLILPRLRFHTASGQCRRSLVGNFILR